MSDLFFSFGAPLPIRDAVLLIKPSEGRLCYFNYNNIPGGVHAGWSDYHKAEVHNIHAYSDDPYQPPLLSQRPWISARYAYSKEETKPDKYWMYYSMFLDDWSRFKVGGGVDIRKKADVLTGGITDPKERLRRLYNFCQSEIVNTDCENSGFLASDIRGLGKNDNSAETLSNARGNTIDISLLFASLARAAGFEVNLALCNDKTLLDWDPKALNYRMVPEFLVAVKDGEKWGFYEPGIPFLPFGMIRPGNEMTTAILGHPDKATLVQTPFAPSSASQLIRAGTFSIDEDGTLHGEATFKYSGHRARQAKNDWVGMSQEDRENDFKSAIRHLVPNAEISEIKFTNLNDHVKDLEVSFKIVVPNYADVTADRILVQPCIFEKGATPLFTRDTRTMDIRFPFTRETHDKIKISYPPTFKVEEGSSPQSLINDESLAYTVQLGKAKKGTALIYLRDFKINVFCLPVTVYPTIKELFDSINQQDHHVISLCRIPAETPVEAPSVPANNP